MRRDNDKAQCVQLPLYKGFCLVTRRVHDTQLTSTTAYKRLSKVGSISILAQAWLESCPVSMRVGLGDRAQSRLLTQLTSTLARLNGVRLRPQHLAISLLAAISELIDSVQLEIHAVAGRTLARHKVFDLLYRIEAKATDLLDLLASLLRLVAATKLPEDIDEATEDEMPYWSSRVSRLAVNDEEAFRKMHFVDSPRPASRPFDCGPDDDAESSCSSDEDESASQARSFYHHSDSSIRKNPTVRGRSLDDDLYTIKPPRDEDRRNSSPSTSSPKSTSTTSTSTSTPPSTPPASVRPKVAVGLAMPRYITTSGKALVEPTYRLDELLSTVTATFPGGLEASLEIRLDKQRSYTVREVAALQRHYGSSLEPLKMESGSTGLSDADILRHDGARWQIAAASSTVCT